MSGHLFRIVYMAEAFLSKVRNKSAQVTTTTTLFCEFPLELCFFLDALLAERVRLDRPLLL